MNFDFKGNITYIVIGATILVVGVSVFGLV
jgi:hypothetical protein